MVNRPSAVDSTSPEAASPTPRRMRLGVDAGRQRALFGLRARLTWRQFMREPGQIAGLLGFLAFFLPVSLGMGVGSAAGYLFAPEPWPGEILGLILTLAWVIWIIAPLLSFRLNQGLDMTKLMTYPLRRHDILVASIAGTVFDLPSYLTLPLVLAIFVGWFAFPVLPVLVVALLIWYAQLMLTSQMVLHASGGLLRSRRFRDLSIVIASLFGMSCYFTSQFVQYFLRDLNEETLANFSALTYLQWTPPGAVARAIERAAAQDWMATVLWLALATAWLIPLGLGWWRVSTRILTGASVFGDSAQAPKPKPVGKRTPRRASTPILWAWLPLPIRQLAWKELIQTWRVPQRRIGMLQGLFMPVLFAIIWGFNPMTDDIGIPLSPWLFMGLPLYTILALWAAGQNMLGWEGPGLQMLVLTPISRRTLLVGKSVGILIQVVGINALLAAILGWTVSTWWVVPGWITAIGAALAGFAALMPAAIRFAHPVNLESTSRNLGETGGGCITGLINGLVVPLAITLINAPVVGVFAWIFFQNAQWAIVPASLLALIYGAVVYMIALRYSERMFLRYEPELITATSKPGEG